MSARTTCQFRSAGLLLCLCQICVTRRVMVQVSQHFITADHCSLEQPFPLALRAHIHFDHASYLFQLAYLLPEQKTTRCNSFSSCFSIWKSCAFHARCVTRLLCVIAHSTSEKSCIESAAAVGSINRVHHFEIAVHSADLSNQSVVCLCPLTWFHHLKRGASAFLVVALTLFH